MTRTLDLNFVDIITIRAESMFHVPNIINDNSQINRGCMYQELTGNPRLIQGWEARSRSHVVWPLPVKQAI